MAGTYLGLRPTQESILKLSTLTDGRGIKNLLPTKDYHLTLLYAPNDKIDLDLKPYVVHEATVTGFDVLGTGKWQGLVVKLRSASLTRRFNAIKKVYGDIHAHPELIVHVTLKYKPESSDLIKLREALTEGMRLSFTGEYMEPLID
jgi:hypothetical protein